MHDSLVPDIDFQDIPTPPIKTFNDNVDERVLSPELSEVINFLKVIDPDPGVKFTFQTFDDFKDKRNGSGKNKPRVALAQILHGTLDKVLPKLIELNRLGAGIFVAVNETDLKGRKAENIVALRALFVDKDDGDLPNLPLLPSSIVQSKNGQHAYWALKPEQSIERFSPAQKSLIRSLNTDKAVHDLPRVMRVPGFWHQKDPNKPFMPRIVQANPVRYTIDEILSAFPIEQNKSKTANKAKPPKMKGSRSFEKYGKWVEAHSTEEGAANPDGGRNNTVMRFVREGLGRGFVEDQLKSVVIAYCSRSGLSEEEGLEVLRRQAEQHEQEPFTSSHATDDGPFRVNERGVFYVDDEMGKAHQWICAPVTVAAFTRNESGRDWGRLLQFRDRDGLEKEWAMPMELLAGDGTVVRGELLNMGLEISASKVARERLSLYLQTQKTDARVRCVSRPGWHGSHYVLPGSSIGSDSAEDRVILQTSDSSAHAVHVNGTLDEWMNEVAVPCSGNPRLVFSISAAFASALLYLTGDESGGFHLRGGSSIGKTTALKVAASVWGSGIKKWRASLNGLEAIAEAHCDKLLILDELGQIDPREAGPAAYMLANGTGKNRANKDGGARAPREWRTLFMSSGECGLAEHMNEGGKRARAGQEVRMADIPADAGKGFGIFDTIHEFSDAATFAAELSHRAMEQYRGTAGTEFLKRLTKDTDRALNYVRQLREAFANKYIPANSSGQAKRVGQRFALAGAAGELARELGIVPWENGDALKASGVCFHAWAKSRGGVGEAEPMAALIQVRAYFEKYGAARFPALRESKEILDDYFQEAVPAGVSSKESSSDQAELFAPDEGRTPLRAGYRKYNPDGTFEWWVLRTIFKEEICKGHDPKMVARELRDCGYLQTDSKGTTTCPKRLPGEVQTIRVYVIRPSVLQGDV